MLTEYVAGRKVRSLTFHRTSLADLSLKEAPPAFSLSDYFGLSTQLLTDRKGVHSQSIKCISFDPMYRGVSSHPYPVIVSIMRSEGPHPNEKQEEANI